MAPPPPSTLPALVGAVLAGGRSTRMGQDKARLQVQGLPLAWRQAELLQQAGCGRVLLVGAHPELARPDLELTVEAPHEGHHPLFGLAQALLAAAPAPLLALPCDLWGLRPEHLQALRAATAPAVLRLGGQIEPLCCLCPAGLAPRALALALEGAPARRFVVDFAPVDLPAGAFRDLDSPQDLREAGLGAPMTQPRPQLNLSEISGPPSPTAEPSEVGWMAALTAMGGALDRGLWPELPAALERLAPVRQVLEGAGDRAALPAQDGGAPWLLFGFPDLRRPSSKVLALREGPDPDAPELRLLHRHPRRSGLCASGGWLPARGEDAGPLSEARYGRPLPRPAGLYADDVDALYLLRGREVLRWDGRKESSLGPPSTALASLVLAWSQR